MTTILEAGVEKAIKADPDGYTLMYGSSATSRCCPHVRGVDRSVEGFDAVRAVRDPTDFDCDQCGATGHESPRNWSDDGKPIPATRMSTAGAGTAGHFAGEMFIAQAGIKPEVVHYRAAGRRSRLSSTTTAMDGTPNRGRMPHVQELQAQGDCDGQPTRLRLLPTCRPLLNPVYPGYQATGWGRNFVPNGIAAGDYRQA